MTFVPVDIVPRSIPVTGKIARAAMTSFLALALAVTSLVLVPANTSRAADIAIQPVSYWEGRFVDSEAYNYTTNLPLSQSGDSWSYYNLAYSIDANVSMFEATGGQKYLDRALEYVNNMKNSARPSSSLPNSQFKDSYLAWGQYSHPDASLIAGGEYALFESYAWRYVARMLRVMHDTPSVLAIPAYLTQYNSLLAFTETNIFDKWTSRGTSSYIYRQNAHMASHWAYIAMEVARLTANSTRAAAATRIVNNIDSLGLPNYPGNSLKGQMRIGTIAPGAYFWSADWDKTATPGQDVSHGNAVASYITEAHDLGTTWTDADMQAMAKTVTDVIMPSAAYVDGTGPGNGWLADGFVKLGRFSVATQLKLEMHQTQGQPQYMASMAVNASRLLSGIAPAPTSSTPTPTPTPTTSTPTPTPTPTTSTPTPTPTPTTSTPTPTPTPTTSTPTTTPGPAKPAFAVVASNMIAPAGTKSVISGSVSPASGGQAIALQQYRSGAWVTVRSGSLSAGSTFSFTTKLGTSTGTFTYRIYKAATASMAAGASPSISIVRTP